MAKSILYFILRDLEQYLRERPPDSVIARAKRVQ